MSVSAIEFFGDRFELGQSFQIAWPSGGALDADQRWQIDAQHIAVEDAHGLRVRPKLVEVAAWDLTEEVDVTDRGRERKLRPRARVAASQRNGSPRGTPRKYGSNGARVAASRSMFTSLRE